MCWSQIFGSIRMTWLLQQSYHDETDNIAKLAKEILFTTNLACCPSERLQDMWIVLEKFEKPQVFGEHYVQRPQNFELNFICSIFMGQNYLFFQNNKVDVNASEAVWQLIFQLLQLLVPVGKSNLEFKLYQSTVYNCHNIIQQTDNEMKISCCAFLMQRILKEWNRNPFQKIYYYTWNEQKITAIKNELFCGSTLINLMNLNNNYIQNGNQMNPIQNIE